MDTAFDCAPVMLGTRHCTAVAVLKLQNIHKQHYTENVKSGKKPTANFQIHFCLQIFLAGTTLKPNNESIRITIADKIYLLQYRDTVEHYFFAAS